MIFNYKRVSTIVQSTERQLIDVPCDREYEDMALSSRIVRLLVWSLDNLIKSFAPSINFSSS